VRSLGRHRRKQKRLRKAKVVDSPFSMLFVDELRELLDELKPIEVGSVLTDRVKRIMGKDAL